MSKSNSGKVSIANILAMIGLAGIGAVSFFGMYLHSKDGSPGAAVIGAVALVAGLAFLLMMSIKAKSAEDNPDKWKFVEWGSIAAYVVVAIVFAAPSQRFFHVVAEKDELQYTARQEIRAIKELYVKYDQQQRTFLKNAREQIENYKLSKQQPYVDNELYEYVKKWVTTIKDWEAYATEIVEMGKDRELADMESEVEVWNILRIPSLAARLEEKGRSAWTDAEGKIREFGADKGESGEEKAPLIPVIGGGGVRPYSFEGLARFELGEPPAAEFAARLRSAEGHTVIGWTIYVILNLLVLLNYAVASRSGFVGPRNNRATGGMDL